MFHQHPFTFLITNVNYIYSQCDVYEIMLWHGCILIIVITFMWSENGTIISSIFRECTLGIHICTWLSLLALHAWCRKKQRLGSGNHSSQTTSISWKLSDDHTSPQLALGAELISYSPCIEVMKAVTPEYRCINSKIQCFIKFVWALMCYSPCTKVVMPKIMVY